MPIIEEQGELRQSFRNEGYSYVSRAREILTRLMEPSQPDELESLAGVTRTLKQQASLAGMFDISNLAYQLEGEIRRLEETQSELTVSHQETLESYVDSIEQFLHFCYQHVGADAPVEQLLKPEEGFQLTRQIQELYLVESREHIQAINSLLLQLESRQADADQAIEEIYRSVHSIKGDSNALSMNEVANKAHALETLLSERQQQPEPLAPDQLEELFAEVAELEQLVQAAAGAVTQALAETQTSPEPEPKPKKPKTVKAVKPAKAGKKAKADRDEAADAAETASGEDLDAPFALDGLAGLGDPFAEPLMQATIELHVSPEQLQEIAQPQLAAAGRDVFDAAASVASEAAAPAPEPLAASDTTEEPDPDADESDDLEFLFENQEILELYYQESLDLLGEISQGLEHLREHGDEGALISDIYRAAHTLKGNSYALGVEVTGRAAQRLEEFLQPLRAAQNCPPEALPQLRTLLKRLQKRLGVIGQRLPGATTAAAAAGVSGAAAVAAPVTSPGLTLDFDNIEIPAEIREIYLEEASDLLEQVTQQLLALELGQAPLAQALNEIFRLVHTLKGNSNALGITELGEVMGRLEDYVDSLRKHPESYTGPELLFQQIDPLKGLFARLNGGEAAAAAAPEIDLSEIPEEIRLIFLEEAMELLENVSHHLLDLESGESTLDHSLDEIYRSIHTFKGNANALGLSFIGDSAHTMESLLSTLRDDPSQYGPTATEALFKHLDGLRRQTDLLQAAGAKLTEPAPEVDLKRTTADLLKTVVTTQERTPQQVIDAVRRDKSLFDDFEKRISASKGPIDSRTTGEIKPDGQSAITPQAQQAQQTIDETIRVSIGKVDKLINLADELLISRISFEQNLRSLRGMIGTVETAQQQMRLVSELVPEAGREALGPLQSMLSKLEQEASQITKGIRKNNAAFGLLVDEIQYNARSTRMLPAAYLINPVRLVVRNTAAKLGKKVQLSILGEEIEMDRLLIEKLKDPLGHLLRNAIDHGIEMPDERQRAGKSPDAHITVMISVAGNMIRFQIHDDGRGINYDRVRQKAVNQGMVSPEGAELLSEYELNNLLFSAGFSTAERITDVSGRGVGLDVVKATLDGLNGTIEVSSSAGRGTIFTLLVPVTLTTFDAFLVHLSGQTFALPRSGVLATLSVKPQDVTDNGISKSIFFAGHPVRLVSLQQLLQLPASAQSDTEFAVLIVESGQQRLALMVDFVLESQQMVMKPLGSQLKKVPYVSGATLLGSGEPVVVLNLAEIVAQLINFGNERISVMAPSAGSQPMTPARRKGKTRVLVVDDSVTTRTLEKNILEAAGFEVVIAKHGREGQETVIREMPNLDLVITDVEMPHMTGYEFASWLKLESEYRATPVIMVTSLASPEFKAKGFASGIDAYIVKGEFNQQTLLDTISQLLVSA